MELIKGALWKNNERKNNEKINENRPVKKKKGTIFTNI
jgi:hypothetical protein